MNGLNRFDGQQFRPFGNQANTTSLVNTNTTSLVNNYITPRFVITTDTYGSAPETAYAGTTRILKNSGN